jgi:hypothetical protein
MWHIVYILIRIKYDAYALSQVSTCVLIGSNEIVRMRTLIVIIGVSYRQTRATIFSVV